MDVASRALLLATSLVKQSTRVSTAASSSPKVSGGLQAFL